MKAWLKGGIILILSVFLMALILAVLGNYSLTPDQQIPYWIFVFYPAGLLLEFIGINISNLTTNFMSLLIYIISSTIIYFLIGALIGLIISKLKSKN